MIRLAVRCRAELAGPVLAELLELAPGGVEEERGEGWVEYAIYGPPGEVPAVPELRAAAGEGLVEISATEIPDDWADRWRDFHEPVSIAGGRIVVRPSWEAAPSDESLVDIVVDPGQAFGTGAHATTRMCLELLLELADAGEASGPLADLGTGSGVLAIAAAKLGFAPVSGCDSEPAALDAAAHNAASNGVEIELLRLNLREQEPPPAPVLVANLTAPLLTGIASRLPVPPRRMVCSGLLSSEVGVVRAALRAGGLEVVGERSRGEWVALLCGGDSDGRPG
ncbi:MAG TPA: 50S ribosomal protein L11 methyltransferase [Solirubrobacterales bacterium]|nr:50S ribosomal protein L11 methyltransferase [Solirubrobacterales bacterium]